MNKQIAIDDTNFIWDRNFAGDPARDRFADARRKCNILLPGPNLARDLMDMGVAVKETRPGERDDPASFVPEYFVPVIVKYRDKTGVPVKYPPRVYLVEDGNVPVLLNEETIGQLDNIRVKNVNVILNPYEYDPIGHRCSLYVRTMYVEHDMDDDPYAKRYMERRYEEDAF